LNRKQAAGPSHAVNLSDPAGMIRDFIKSQGQVAADDTSFSDDIDLFDYGYLDSFGIVGLIESVAQTYDIDLSAVDFYEPGKRTVRGIAKLIEEQLAARDGQR
jgi:acyl carrier protein